jgi:hypothetical protein
MWNARIVGHEKNYRKFGNTTDTENETELRKELGGSFIF